LLILFGVFKSKILSLAAKGALGNPLSENDRKDPKNLAL
jgi:hypothetical protein